LTAFFDNPFLTVFIAIRDLHARLLAEEHEGMADITAQISSEADEDKPERSSKELLHRLMEVILLYFSLHTRGEDWLRRCVGDWEEASDSFVPDPLLHCMAVDDGYLYLGRASKFSGSNRFPKIPVVRYEVKTLNEQTSKGKVNKVMCIDSAGDNSSRKPVTTLPFEVRAANSPHLQAFNIGIRHTYLTISRIIATPEYLEAVQSQPSLAYDDATINFRQTREYNLLLHEDRQEASKAIWALLNYLHYGKPMIGRL
ncbi:hypothetical protein DFH07DRAFT_708742, partial [Mycena maculata]